MGCPELKITDYFRLTPTTCKPDKYIPASASTKKTAYSGFFPVVSVSMSNYRYYSPEAGKWLSRDPIGEKGFLDKFLDKYLNKYTNKKLYLKLEYIYEQSLLPPYLFVKNAPILFADKYGLAIAKGFKKCTHCSLGFANIDPKTAPAGFDQRTTVTANGKCDYDPVGDPQYDDPLIQSAHDFLRKCKCQLIKCTVMFSYKSEIKINELTKKPELTWVEESHLADGCP